ncbi:XRN 5'-3' exonuclease N-terminus-domain-containing protein [Suillus subalutaceus]|uniref:XRN 5'-3' exonuclease N-terminus-domain-containing protein n=1 Tax=Suillus subalutaceus TaxID=48586 RepID=UPI001B860152|nr:XRN 5'-3' exonuclease N-terminus-domain-containing protein [Suillus subalutaceus]KAG1834956.1 XRN 5'-3' exonuclease N-terminus-domain-containing protein [Suillus subalutaceus]
MYLDFNGIIHNYAHFRMSEKQIFIAVDGEAKEIREKAESKGEELPDEKAFDSNYITPGAPFTKITEDTNWRGVQAVLSGHEAPGEEPDYNPNVRHCLYGPDADLIMLSPLSHDPHFCLLREQVKFGPAAKRKERVIDDFILLAVFVGNDFST